MTPAPNSPSNTFPGNRLPDYQGGVYSGTPSAPEPAPTPQGLNAHWASPEYVRAAQQSDKSGLELESDRRANATANDPIKSIVLTGTSGPSNAGSPSPERSPQAAPSAASAQEITPQQATLNSAIESQRRKDLINGKPDTMTEAALPKSREIMPGIYEHKRGQYSDNPNGLGLPENKGKPSAENIAIAQRMHEQGRLESAQRIAAKTSDPYWHGRAKGFSEAESRQYAAEVAGAQQNAAVMQRGTAQRLMSEWNDLNSDVRKAWRNQDVTIRSTMDAQGKFGGRDGGAKQSAAAAQKAILESHFGRVKDGDRLDEQARQFDTNTARNDATSAYNQRLGQEQHDMGMRQAAAQQLQQERRAGALGEYSRATTPEQRAETAARYPDVFPQKEQAAPRGFKMEVLRGGKDPETGAVSPDRAVMVDERSGRYQFIDMGGGNADKPLAMPKNKAEMVKGQQYQTPDGVMVWDGENLRIQRQ